MAASRTASAPRSTRHFTYDDNGQLTSGTFMDYLIPSALEIPSIKIVDHCTPSPLTTFGQKGSGEAGYLGAPAAVANAVNDALAPLGVEVNDAADLPSRHLGDAHEGKRQGLGRGLISRRCSEIAADITSRRLRARRATCSYPFLFAGGFATSRACSMNSRATGLSVRFFRVTMPFWTCAIGSSIGRTMIFACLVENLIAEAGKTVRKRPVVTRLIRASGETVATVARG